MGRIVGIGLLVLVVGAIVASWVLAGDLYGGGTDDLRTVTHAGRDDPLVARAIAEARLTVPASATDLAAQVSDESGFSAVSFTLPSADVADLLTGSGVPTPFDEDPALPPAVPALGWEPTDPSDLVAVSDVVDGRRRLVALDLSDPDRPRVLVRSSAATAE